MEGDINISDDRGILVIEVMVDKFDFFLISDHADRLRDLLAERRYPPTIFDLARVKVIDSSVFGFLLEIRNAMKKKGREIAVVCVDPEVLHVMEMLKVSRFISVFQSRDRAGKYLNSL
jgi:anti-anti-sigma factor